MIECVDGDGNFLEVFFCFMGGDDDFVEDDDVGFWFLIFFVFLSNEWFDEFEGY